MVTFTKNKQTGQYDVIGPVSEVAIGSVCVTKRSGESTTVHVSRVSKSFVAKFGPSAGQPCRIGTVAAQRQRRDSAYCYYPCPVTGRKCCPENGPCHDCE